MKDFYKVLEIDSEASLEVMNKAYRALVQKYHPDRYHISDKALMTQKMQEINEAYDVLSNPQLRRQYDMERQAPTNTDPQGHPVALAQTRQGLRETLFWFLLTIMVIGLVWLLGRFLFTNPLGRLLLVGAVAYAIIRWRPAGRRRSR